jgi:ribulose-5-phosphate 4-epimerase/fuculose-1-phosphate aldolase
MHRARAGVSIARMSTSPLAQILDELVAANRILAHYGVLDGFGHVSARHPDHPDRFLLSRSLAPELITAADIMTFGPDSEPVGNDTRQPYLERYIHGEIFGARPEVMAVVHSHSPSVIPFAASSVKLRPIYHMGSFLGAGAGVFDIRKRFGCTDMLIRNCAQGAALAESLGSDAVVLMRGHGFVTVGDSVPVAVFRAMYTETNASIHSRAIALGGDVTPLEPDEAALSEATNRSVVMRPWTLWRRKVMGDA